MFALRLREDKIECENEWGVATLNCRHQAAAAKATISGKAAGCDERGRYHVDTADKVSEMISAFLLEKDFEAYAKDPDNYQVR